MRVFVKEYRDEKDECRDECEYRRHDLIADEGRKACGNYRGHQNDDEQPPRVGAYRDTSDMSQNELPLNSLKKAHRSIDEETRAIRRTKNSMRFSYFQYLATLNCRQVFRQLTRLKPANLDYLGALDAWVAIGHGGKKYFDMCAGGSNRV